MDVALADDDVDAVTRRVHVIVFLFEPAGEIIAQRIGARESVQPFHREIKRCPVRSENRPFDLGGARRVLDLDETLAVQQLEFAGDVMRKRLVRGQGLAPVDPGNFRSCRCANAAHYTDTPNPFRAFSTMPYRCSKCLCLSSNGLKIPLIATRLSNPNQTCWPLETPLAGAVRPAPARRSIP